MGSQAAGIGADAVSVGQVAADADRLGPAGDPVEGDERAIDIDLNSPAKE